MSYPRFIVGPLSWFGDYEGPDLDRDTIVWRFTQPIYGLVLDGLIPLLTFPC